MVVEAAGTFCEKHRRWRKKHEICAMCVEEKESMFSYPLGSIAPERMHSWPYPSNPKEKEVSKSQYTPLVFDPTNCDKITRGAKYAEDYRGEGVCLVWRYNPWVGTLRHESDIASDPLGRGIYVDGEPYFAAAEDRITEKTPSTEFNGLQSRINDNHLRDTIETTTFGALNTAVAAGVNDVDATLAERGKRYGLFVNHAEITQRLKTDMVCMPKWRDLGDDQKEALEMIAHKIGRILNGDPNYADSWIDIAGYAKLIADRLEGVVR